MGIPIQLATAIIRAHKNAPIHGRLLVCGRQSIFLTPAETWDLMRSHGVAPRISIEQCEVDRETRIGGEGQETRKGHFISDRSFFKMLGVDVVEFLDHSDYEGANITVDLNNPISDELDCKYDFIIDGGTLDNVFNPAQALMNLVRMLKHGGRIVTFNYYANFGATYVMLPHQWYLDFFAINAFAFAQTYFFIIDSSDGAMSVYQANLTKRASSRAIVLNFPAVEPTAAIVLFVYAVKAIDSTWSRQPSQECYRDDKEWREMEPIFSRFAAYKMKIPLLQSTATRPIVMPGGDDFQYIDTEGNTIAESSRSNHDQKLRWNILAAMRKMDAAFHDKSWAILETEKIFYDLINESDEARQIVAKSNVILFDVRMLNQSIFVDGILKEIHPAGTALGCNMPILIICAEPQIDVFWKRASRLFRHLSLYSACYTQDVRSPDIVDGSVDDLPVDYFSFPIYLSPSLEHGSYEARSASLAEMGFETVNSSISLRQVPGWELQKEIGYRYWRKARRICGFK